MSTQPVLEISRIAGGYGDFQAVFDISLTVAPGELLALVGANGAGKTTLMRLISGVLRPWSGTVRFDGQDLSSLPDFRRAQLGIGMVPEGRRLFGSLTVQENLLVGAATGRSGPWDLEAVFTTLPIVAERRHRQAARLSGGEQQAAAIGRALMGNPRLLLLDEVSLGLAPVVVDQLYAAMPAIRATGTTVILVEQDLGRTLAVADTVVCVLEGRAALSGRVKDLTRDDVTAAYFGTSHPIGRQGAS